MPKVVDSRICTKCGEGKKLSEFYRKCTGRYGYWEQCKTCVAIKQKSYYQANREKCLARQKISGKKYYEANREKIQAYRDAHKERTKIYNKMYKAIDPEKTRVRARAERDKHSERYKKQGAIYRKTHKQEIIARNKLYNQTGGKVARLRLSDSYIKSLLTKHDSILRYRDIPVELVVLKRVQIQIERELKKETA